MSAKETFKELKKKFKETSLEDPLEGHDEDDALKMELVPGPHSWLVQFSDPERAAQLSLTGAAYVLKEMDGIEEKVLDTEGFIDKYAMRDRFWRMVIDAQEESMVAWLKANVRQCF